MKARLSERDYTVSLEELENIVSMDKTAESDAFCNYLMSLIFEITGAKYSLKKIADTSHLARNDLSRFPIQKHEYIASVAKAFNLPLDNARQLYKRCGLCISLQNKYDLEYIKEVIQPEEIDSLPYYINRMSHVDCILNLIQQHKYDETTDIGLQMNAFKIMLKGISDFSEVDFTQKKQYINYLLCIIETQAKKNNWVVRIPDYVSSSDEKSRKRETAFEISYVCDFDLDETETLFNSFGFTLCPEHIKFDAYIVWLQENAPEPGDFYYLYKSVCSDIDEITYGDFKRKDVTLDRLSKILSINTYSRDDLISILYGEKDR